MYNEETDKYECIVCPNAFDTKMEWRNHICEFVEQHGGYEKN